MLDVDRRDGPVVGPKFQIVVVAAIIPLGVSERSLLEEIGNLALALEH